MDASARMTVPDLLRIQVERNPDKDFLVFESDAGAVSRYSYAEIGERVARLANHLADSGIRPGDTVAVMMTNKPEFMVAWLAANQLGGVAIPVNVHYTPDELAYLVGNAKVAAIVIEPRFREVFDAIGTAADSIRVRVMTGEGAAPEGYARFETVMAEGDPTDRKCPVGSDDPSQIIYTSGTTSRPKGAVLDHRNSILQGVITAMTFGLRDDDRICVVLPLFHVNAQFIGAIPTLTAGGTIVLLESFSATRFWDQVRRHDCTGISIVPMILRTMLAQPPADTDRDHNLRFSFYALPTSPEEWQSFEDRFNVTLVEGYGLTETFGICTCNPLVYGRTKRHNIGLPLPGHDVRVVDEDMNDLPQGEVGQIVVSGKPLFSHYLGNEEASAACRRDGWFLTGDNGYFDADGYLNFFDRGKDIIKRAGENIAATEVERVLNDHPEILESAVVGIFDPLRDEAVKAFVVRQPGATIDEEGVQAWCAKYLSRFKVPGFVEFRDTLPKTSIGKIQKYVLKNEEAARSGG